MQVVVQGVDLTQSIGVEARRGGDISDAGGLLPLERGPDRDEILVELSVQLFGRWTLAALRPDDARRIAAALLVAANSAENGSKRKICHKNLERAQLRELAEIGKRIDEGEPIPPKPPAAAICGRLLSEIVPNDGDFYVFGGCERGDGYANCRGRICTIEGSRIVLRNNVTGSTSSFYVEHENLRVAVRAMQLFIDHNFAIHGEYGKGVAIGCDSSKGGWRVS